MTELQYHHNGIIHYPDHNGIIHYPDQVINTPIL